jgi:hypothetical protein
MLTDDSMGQTRKVAERATGDLRLIRQETARRVCSWTGAYRRSICVCHPSGLYYWKIDRDW